MLNLTSRVVNLDSFKIRTDKNRSTNLSRDMATKVKILMLTLRICTVGQNWHMKAGKSQR